MKSSSWLSSLSTDALTSCTTVYITSNTANPLYMSSLLQSIQRSIGFSFVHLSVSERQTDIEHQLAISFLGQKQWYWLGSLDVLPSQRRTYWLEYLKMYQGPHSVWCHTNEPIANQKQSLTITLPDVVDYQEFVKMGSYLFPMLSQERCSLFKDVFKERKALSLDAACLILQYACILSVQQIKVFIAEWVDLLLVPEHSLFSLSTLYFSKDTSAFLSLWALLKHVYSVHFWITYWSEQLFRAHQYIDAKRTKDVISAKKYAYRLPFSFIQRDWKKYTTDELCKAHHRLYELDFQLKQGGDECFLDLWIYESIS